MSEESRLQEAKRRYQLATNEWHRQRGLQGIVEETEERERMLGVRFKGVTPEGKLALSWWQQRKAELDAAIEYERPMTHIAPPASAPEADRRLPPEREPESGPCAAES